MSTPRTAHERHMQAAAYARAEKVKRTAGKATPTVAAWSGVASDKTPQERAELKARALELADDPKYGETVRDEFRRIAAQL